MRPNAAWPSALAAQDEDMLSLIRKSLYLAAGDRRWPWFLVILLALGVSGVEAVGAVLIFGLVGLITSPAQPVELPLVGPVRLVDGEGADDIVVTAALVVAGFFIVRALIIIGMMYVQARVTQSAGARLASRLHRGYLDMPYSFLIMTNSSQQIRNVQDTVPRVVADVFVQGTRAASELVVVIVLSLVLVVVSPLAMGLLIVVLMPGLVALNRVLRPRLETLGRQTQDLSRQSVQLLQETLQGLREIRVRGREEQFAGLFASIRHALAQSKYRRSVLHILPSVALETGLVLFITSFLALAVSGGDEARDVLPVLGMFAYVGFRLKPSLNQLVDGANALRYSAAAIEDLHSDLRRGEMWSEAARRPAPPLSFHRTIELRGVSFGYPGSATPALSDIHLTIPRGSAVGFVGETGGGKSTLLDVIVGLLEPDRGTVYVDGVDIRGARATWMQRIGLVSQATFLLDTSIRKNIALGHSDADIDDERVRQVLAMAKLLDFVDTLPDGLETVLGERGVRLSGGQRQRIAIARALYPNPDILVLDEGTAALDNRTEAEVMSALGSLRGTCTLLMVAHRLSTVRDCDVIHVISGGRLVAAGTYDDLARVRSEFKDVAR